MTALDFLSETPELSDVVCLQKPFRPADLMRAIEAAQGSRRQPADAVAAAADSASGIICLQCWPTAFGRQVTARRVAGHCRRRASISETGSAANCRVRQGDRQAANEALRAPVEFGLATELQLDAGDHAAGSESPRHRLLDRRPAGLHPYDLEKARMVFPAHRQPARQRRQGAVLRRIGDEFVQRQRDGLGRRRLELDLRTTTTRSGRRWNRAPAPRRSVF